MSEAQLLTRPAAEAEDSTKRRQILDGARGVFLARGFDAASMMDIAKAADVSKGTLYVYFKNKEELFSAIVQEECRTQAEGTFTLDDTDHDVKAVLTRLGVDFIKFLTVSNKASSLRIVIAIADRMPEIGKAFYQTGPAYGIAHLKAYLDAQVRAGIVEIGDTEVAAAQFLDSCQGIVFKPMLFNAAPQPSAERVRYVVDIAVRTFLAAYPVR